MAETQSTDGYWTLDAEGLFEFRDAESDEVLDTLEFTKAKSLTAFFMWQMIESIGE